MMERFARVASYLPSVDAWSARDTMIDAARGVIGIDFFSIIPSDSPSPKGSWFGLPKGARSPRRWAAGAKGTKKRVAVSIGVARRREGSEETLEAKLIIQTSAVAASLSSLCAGNWKAALEGG